MYNQVEGHICVYNQVEGHICVYHSRKSITEQLSDNLVTAGLVIQELYDSLYMNHIRLW